MVSGDEPELDAFVHDAHAVFGLDALVAVPDHVLVEHHGELMQELSVILIKIVLVIYTSKMI